MGKNQMPKKSAMEMKPQVAYMGPPIDDAPSAPVVKPLSLFDKIKKFIGLK
ncbi:Uncharacterised protein [Candidatus Bilamarchaeum dharawalense]|uniref:Uncharacterized protein n=1 Tax=Candidatus Bilamarchaeum dharawalense TaxID=2885759 RepID=A0A5E4LVS1_9ARCH|nr:Uncharacterised protein [Candidatus Bilamarchaeum dharawalense]